MGNGPQLIGDILASGQVVPGSFFHNPRCTQCGKQKPYLTSFVRGLGGPGTDRREPILDRGRNLFSLCPCLGKDAAEIQAASDDVRKPLDVPEAYAAFADFEHFPDEAAELWDFYHRGPSAGWLSILGATGLGKTTICWAFAKLRHSDEQPCRLLHALTEFAEMTSRRDWPHDARSLGHYRGLLILDDLFAGDMSKTEFKAILICLHHRDENNLPTILSTNLTMDQIAAQVSSRIASRMARGRIIQIQGGDRRVGVSA